MRFVFAHTVNGQSPLIFVAAHPPAIGIELGIGNLTNILMSAGKRRPRFNVQQITGHISTRHGIVNNVGQGIITDKAHQGDCKSSFGQAKRQTGSAVVPQVFTARKGLVRGELMINPNISHHQDMTVPRY